MAHGGKFIISTRIESNGVQKGKYDVIEDVAQDFYNQLQTGSGNITYLTQDAHSLRPEDWEKYKNFVISSSISINITGWASGEDWEEKRIIIAEGSASITFKNEDSNSMVSNQMYCRYNGDIIGSARDFFNMVYDPIVNKWRIK